MHNLSTSHKRKAKSTELKQLSATARFAACRLFYFFFYLYPTQSLFIIRRHTSYISPDACYILFSPEHWPVFWSLRFLQRQALCCSQHQPREDLGTEAHLPPALRRKDATIILPHTTQEKLVDLFIYWLVRIISSSHHILSTCPWEWERLWLGYRLRHTLEEAKVRGKNSGKTRG